MRNALVAIPVRLTVVDGQSRGSEEMRLVTIVCATASLPLVPLQGRDYAGIAAELDQARVEIAPPLGATKYTLYNRRLLNQTGDENRSLAQSLGQLPGVMLGTDG
jgi:hypothetical protein